MLCICEPTVKVKETFQMQNEWDLGVKAACLAYNTTVHTSTGQTPIFATFGLEATVLVHWIYLVPKADREMELSD